MGRGLVVPGLVALYLLFIVLANVTVAILGPAWGPVISFVAIGFDLSCRDRLHEAWHGRGLWPRMLGMIAAGGVLSWLFSMLMGVLDAGGLASWLADPEAGRVVLRVALGSTLAFASAGALDAVVYQLLWARGASRMARVNASNFFAAIADSAVFLAVAFGLSPLAAGWIFPGEIAAKIGGGFLWSLMLFRGLPALKRTAAQA